MLCFHPRGRRASSPNFFSNVRYIYLAFAFGKQDNPQEAENAYLAATRINANDKQAWQGLVTLYEKAGDSKLDEWHDAALRLAQMFADSYVFLSIVVCHPVMNEPRAHQYP